MVSSRDTFRKNVSAAAAAHRYRPYSTVNARGSYAKRRAAASIKSYPAYGDCIYDSPYIKSLRSANCFHDNLSSDVSRRDCSMRSAHNFDLFPRTSYEWSTTKFPLVSNGATKWDNAGSRNLILKRKIWNNDILKVIVEKTFRDTYFRCSILFFIFKSKTFPFVILYIFNFFQIFQCHVIKIAATGSPSDNCILANNYWHVNEFSTVNKC